MNSLKKSSKFSLDLMTTEIPSLLGRPAPSPLKRIYEAYTQLTSFKKAAAFIGLGLFFSGCTTTYNPFYDERSEKVAEQVKEYLKGFNPAETTIFKDKSTEKKILKDFEYV